MQDHNRIVFIGRVGGEIRTFGEGDHAGCSFSVASNSSKKNEAGEWEDKPLWFNVSVYGKLAEYAKKTFGKGSKLYVDGRFDTRTYEKDGKPGLSLEVKAGTLINLTPKPHDDGKAPF